jgi:hypothetical protein
MLLSFSDTEPLPKWWGGPPGPRPTPVGLLVPCMMLTSLTASGTRASRADQGVRPTLFPQDLQLWEK